MILTAAYDYDEAGRLKDTTDPRAIVARTSYDLLGRVTQTIADYTDGTPTASSNQTTDYTYDGSDHVLTMKAALPGSAFQETKYIYGVSQSSGSDIDSNDLLSAVQYPGPSATSPERGEALMNPLSLRGGQGEGWE